MIKVESIETFNFEGAIRGLRNPMNSWDKSDSYWCKGFDDKWEYKIGDNDLDLMHRLYVAGSEHRKYLRQVFVSMDITAPLYWLKEFDTYKVGTTANSCSTMHKIHTKKFELDDFSHDYLDTLDGYHGLVANDAWARIVDTLNFYRDLFNDTKDKRYWRMMIEMLPSSYNQKRTITMTYENVVSIIKQRRTHKLDEWRDFCNILLDLPYIEDIIGTEVST